MRRCTYCFHFHPGAPTFCARCGRSFSVRICSRGHANARTATFCTQCGSADLSTPAPPASVLYRLSGVVLYAFAVIVGGLVAAVIVLSLLRSIDLQAVAGPLVLLVVMFLFLNWTISLLPGPIKHAGKHVGQALVRSMRRKKHD